MTVLYILAHT